MKLNFKISFSNLYTRDGLIKLDETFLNYIKSCDESLFYSLIEAREKAASSLMSSQCHLPSSQCHPPVIPVLDTGI
ncbi:hypothetical protein [Wolbachia pipientis]|uniref:hypothetical protein n=1 Tax=Wolbachia pipientis TaxID=955 RepID=UPI0035C20833